MDIELVLRAQGGDHGAFATLADEVLDRLLGVAQHILGDTHLAEDATQQALLNVWRELPKLRDPERFEAWSYRLLVNACHTEARRWRHWMPNVGIQPHTEPAATDAFGSVADRDQVERAFRRLSVDQRAVVVLHHYRGVPIEEVAGLLGIPLGTVRSRLRHAMRGLRAALEADDRSSALEHSARGVAR